MYPEILQKALLSVTDENGRVTDHEVQVVDITPQSIFINPPLDKSGYPMLLEVGSSVRLGYGGTAFYHFDTNVVSHIKDNIHMFALRRPLESEIKKTQRRLNFRVSVMVDAHVEFEGKELSLSLRDLSGGGCLIVSKKKLWDVASEFSGALLLPVKDQLQKVKFKGLVKREILDDKSGNYLYGVEFKGLNMRDEDMISRYCMDRQLQQRRAAGPN